MESTATSLTASLLPAPRRKPSFARAAAALIGAILLFTACVALALVLVVPGLTTVGLLAYAFGCRHGVDADHIAAIDNVTRRLVASGRRATTVGVFFSLGHCTVVLVLCAAVVASAGAISGAQLERFARAGAAIGPWVAAAVLVAIGALNLVAARDLRGVRKREAVGHAHGVASLVGRCCPALVAAVDEPWKVTLIGLLFGLGLDTATEIALLTLTALAQPGVPPWGALVLPLLFAAGMALVDSLNGLLMVWAYEWAAENGPMHRLYFSYFLTVASAVLALAIGAVEASASSPPCSQKRAAAAGLGRDGDEPPRGRRPRDRGRLPRRDRRGGRPRRAACRRRRCASRSGASWAASSATIWRRRVHSEVEIYSGFQRQSMFETHRRAASLRDLHAGRYIFDTSSIAVAGGGGGRVRRLLRLHRRPSPWWAFSASMKSDSR